MEKQKMTKYTHEVHDGVDYYVPSWNYMEDHWLKIPECRQRFMKQPHEQQQIENTGVAFERMIWSIFGGGLAFGLAGIYGSGIFTILSNLILTNLEKTIQNAYRGRTWFSSDGHWQYCKYPRENFIKSKFPDKFGEPCYCRKVDVNLTGYIGSWQGSRVLNARFPAENWFILAYTKSDESQFLTPVFVGSCGALSAQNSFPPIFTKSGFCLLMTPDIELDGYTLSRCYNTSLKTYLINYIDIDGIRCARVAIPKNDQNRNGNQVIIFEYE